MRRAALRLLTFIALHLLFLPAIAAEKLSYVVQGVDNEEVRNNIALHLASVDITEDQIGDPFWQDELSKTIEKAVEPYGYYNSKTEFELDGPTELALTVSLNSPLRVANITREIIGEGRQDPDFKATYDAFPLKKGDVLLQPRYSAYKTSMFNYALEHGYFDFFWQATRLDLVREDREANILLIAQSGARYQFGELVIVGDDKASDIINRLRNFTAGEPYNGNRLREFNRILNKSGYFDRVIARPVVSNADGLLVPIEVSVTHKPKDKFDVSLGAATDTGARVRLGWERPWVNSKGHSITSDIFVSQPEQAVSVGYRIPMKNTTDDSVKIEGGYQFIDYANTGFESETLSIAAHRYWRPDNSEWQHDGSITLLRETYDQIQLTNNTTLLAMPGYAITHKRKDDDLNINQGHYINMFVQGGSADLGSDIDFFRAQASALYINTYHQVHRISVRGTLGALYTNDFDKVPASLRFYAGGDQSIRGFDFREISPIENVLDPNTGESISASVGGKYLMNASVEYTYAIAEQWRIALFTDAGTASNSIDTDLTFSVGTGAHWISPIGPVRLYFAVGFPPDNGNTRQFHLMLGPEI
ncbi:autotransporter assembly complex family protein [Alteromonas sp. KUL49]|uniref:autotransporter assembly complex protein TamA n=1 Tax=Alteromonas sp. KUL49 TaxID=2480798 RepID=UPI00102EE674|nr:autotransporter assembly complex family protein [Alteromonas sp. KUL49]TAP42138.1 outer membrane protein assembly factor [Alteromonas sp. KUL49]GEA09723.1 outer membrane protein assembly factor [Alteromonas sp. KUL49]